MEQIRFDLRSAVAETITLIRPQAAEKNLALTMDYPGEVPVWVVGDPTRVRQIVVNYLSNAVKFTEAGAVKVDVRANFQPDGTVQVRIEVHDTGPGIPADIQSRLFANFEQADPSVSRRHGGSGLGLAISRQLATLMGGSVGILSEIGRGSTFWVELPFTLPVAAPAPEPTQSSVDSKNEETAGGRRVLLAEDNPVNRILATRLLEKLGCQVDVVVDGGQAVAQCLDRHYDAVFMDCQMPDMDGYKATRLIRKQQRDPIARVPIIAFTAHAMAGDRKRCLDAGMDDYLTKPLELKELARVVKQWMPADKQ